MTPMASGAQRWAWAWWIPITVIGAVVGSVAAFQVRSLPAGPYWAGRDLGYVATVVDVIILSGAQWFLLRQYRLRVDWWVPATVTAGLLSAIVLIPTVLNGFGPATNAGTVLLSSAAALGAAGLLTGTAQALVLRGSIPAAWAWIPATAFGGAAAGALTSALASDLLKLQLPGIVLLSLVAGMGGLLIAATQGTVLQRVLAR